ncbi:MAG: chloride channel protein, partial [Firmicutes bacterium]|nr:chloride channel protein [Bacillota bacterium]
MKVSKQWKTEWNEHISGFFKLILFALIIGITVGVVGAAFHHAIEIATALRIQYPWILYLMPLAGVCIIGLYRICGIEKDRGTNFVLTAVREDEPMYFRKAPLIFISTVLTHLVGGSSGREGAALQLGGAISGEIGHAMGLDDKDKKLITMCGMAAGFSALFGTPITAAIFAMEVISVGVMYYAALVPCVLGAIIAAMTAQCLHGEATFFVLNNIPEVTVGTVIRVLLLGILCSTVSIIFCYVNHKTPKIYGKYLPNPMVRAAVGGCIVIGLTLVVGTRDYNGAGMDTITRALQGEAVPYAFALKILFTAITLGAGFKGGEIVPVFFTGATFGCVVG